MLTAREFEIYMAIVTRAAARKELTREFGIAYTTLNVHMKNIYRKMGCNTPLELFSQYQFREHRPDLNI